jgi:hypothetical protein
LDQIVGFFDKSTSTLAAAIALALIVAIVKLVSDNHLERSKRRVRRLQDQVEQFYGPLFSIVGQLTTTAEIEGRIRKENALDDSQQQSREKFMLYNFYLPLHQQIRAILQSRLYLVNGLSVPQSVEIYLRHSMQYEVQSRLWFECQIESGETEGTPYPVDFNSDIRAGLDKAMEELGPALKSLKV